MYAQKNLEITAQKIKAPKKRFYRRLGDFLLYYVAQVAFLLVMAFAASKNKTVNTTPMMSVIIALGIKPAIIYITNDITATLMA